MKCQFETIPEYLHSNEKSAVNEINEDDLFYMWFKGDLDEGSRMIPGHNKLHNQSVDSDLLNPSGSASDVLFDTKNGEHNHEKGLSTATLDHKSIISFRKIDELKQVRLNKEVVYPKPVYTFKVVHSPTPCKFPHCEIILNVDDKQETEDSYIINKTMKTYIRLRFRNIALQHKIIRS